VCSPSNTAHLPLLHPPLTEWFLFPYPKSDQPEPADLPRLYPLSLTNNLNKELHLGRGENPKITIEPRASVSIEPDDQIFLTPSDPSVDSIRYLLPKFYHLLRANAGAISDVVVSLF
jgi:hypothetical protein